MSEPAAMRISATAFSFWDEAVFFYQEKFLFSLAKAIGRGDTPSIPSF